MLIITGVRFILIVRIGQKRLPLEIVEEPVNIGVVEEGADVGEERAAWGGRGAWCVVRVAC